MMTFKTGDKAGVEAVIKALRPFDVHEIEVFRHEPAEFVVKQSYNLAIREAVIYWEEEPVAFVGLISKDVLAEFAVPFFFATSWVDNNKYKFARYSRPVVKRVMSGYNLANFILAENDFIVRWLQWLDFTVEPVVECGTIRVRTFWRAKDV
jgi:hypothetical protein